jgi:hypothetical protein
MDTEEVKHIIDIISKGNTSVAEDLFKKPGGRKYLESIVLAILCTMPVEKEKEDLFRAFRKGLDKVEQRIKRQREGQRILEQINL